MFIMPGIAKETKNSIKIPNRVRQISRNFLKLDFKADSLQDSKFDCFVSLIILGDINI